MEEKDQKKVLDVNATTSDLPGLSGLVESTLRKAKNIAFFLVMVPICILYVFCVTVSLLPGITLYREVSAMTANSSVFWQNAGMAFSFASTYFLYGLTLIFVVPVVNKLLPLKVKPHRATWYSLSVVPWYYHNALTYLVRYTFLEFLTPTPLNILFYRMMGMKIGKGSIINTTNISDPCLIELGDYVTIGGSATLVAHYGMKGFLIIDRLVIEDKATVGLKATVFGDVVIGKGALIKAGEVVMPKARIPAREESSKESTKPESLPA
jgi:serine acetyltransferase